MPLLDSGVTVVVGAQWGDEGKGKLVDLLAEEADLVCRCQGGNNAGHTVIVGNVSYDFHLLPSGIIHQKCWSVIGNGVVVNVPGLFEEIKKNEAKGLKGWKERLVVSDRAHLVFDLHQAIDGLIETEKGKSSLGTTRRGIGPAYTAKAARDGFRVCDLYGDWEVFEERFKLLVKNYQKRFPDLQVNVESEIKRYKVLAAELEPMVVDTVLFLSKAMAEKKKIIVEGANASMLDIDFGTYPYVTSSNCTVGGAITGLGIPPQSIKNVYGVFKAYATRVGIGAFPTELMDEVGDALQRIGKEFGVTTGRRRRCGWFDVVVARYSSMVNGLTGVVITKLDVLDTFKEIRIGVSYTLGGKPVEGMPALQSQLQRVVVEYLTLPGWCTSTAGVTNFADLPQRAQDYVMKLQALVGVPIRWVGTGASRGDMIHLQ